MASKEKRIVIKVCVRNQKSTWFPMLLQAQARAYLPAPHVCVQVPVLGCSSVGKTSLMKRYCNNTYSSDRRAPGRPVLRLLGIFTVHHDMQVLVNLIVQRRRNFWVSMSQGAHSDATHQIEQAFSTVRNQPTTLCFHNPLAQWVLYIVI